MKEVLIIYDGRNGDRFVSSVLKCNDEYGLAAFDRERLRHLLIGMD